MKILNNSSEKTTPVLWNCFVGGLTSHWYLTAGFDTFIMLRQRMLYRVQKSIPFFFVLHLTKTLVLFEPWALKVSVLYCYFRWLRSAIIWSVNGPGTCSRTNLMKNKIVKKQDLHPTPTKLSLLLSRFLHGTTSKVLSSRLLCNFQQIHGCLSSIDTNN